MKACLKGIVALELQEDILDWSPSEKEFGVDLTLFIGSENTNKSDAFDVVLCTPGWFALRPLPSSFTHGTYFIFVETFDYSRLEAHLNERCQACSGESWHELAMQINNWARWEFAYTRPMSGK